MYSPKTLEMVPFNLSPVTSGSIKRILKKELSNSTPGDDEILYHHLKKMPSTHHFFANLFSKLLLEKQEAPESWSKAKIKLIFKGGNEQSSRNYHPIGLTLAVGKLLHKIITVQLERYLIDKNIIDMSLEKVFLTGINSAMEHIFSHSHGVKCHSAWLAVSHHLCWSEKAFSLISHKLIIDMMTHCRLPLEVTNYISSLYSQLTAYVKMKNWTMETFRIRKRVFQQDTLSPLFS